MFPQSCDTLAGVERRASSRRADSLSRVLWTTLLLVGGAGCEQHPSSTTASNDTTIARPKAMTTRSDDVDESSPIRLAVHNSTAANDPDALSSSTVPAWAADAVFYQLFPERFANGDRSNDPTRESLESPDSVPASWAITPWTSDWYARSKWERQLGDGFYAKGVFDRRYGGDLLGIIDKLDYLKSLGINTLYLNPVFYARSLHKYDGNSFHHVDPYFGPNPTGDLALMAQETSDPATWHWTEADKLFLELVRQAHARELRVIIDGVFNHTGRDFFAFADLRSRQAESPYRDWYIVQTYDDPATPQQEFRYKGWWGVGTLPEFADNGAGDDLHPGPKQYILDSTRRWMDPNADGDPADGIDGWRLDVANEVPTGFWRDWHRTARQVNPDVYTVAEIWDDAAKFLAEGGFSASMNYHGFAFPVKGFLIDEVLSPTGAAGELDQRRNGFSRPVQYALQSLVDSHDTDRLASMIVNAGRRPYTQPDRFDYDVNVSPRYVPSYDVRKPNDHERRVQRLVALMQMTYVGAPMIYYGTEAGMWGADDPCDRMPMVWQELSYEPQSHDPLGRERQPDSVAFDESLFGFYRAAIHLRQDHPALRRGDLEFVATNDAAQFLAFRRTVPEETLLVGFNRGDAPFQWEVPLAAGQSVVQIFTASGRVDKFTIVREADRAVVTVPECDAAVLRVAPQE